MTVVSALFIIAGSLFCLVGAVGLLRFSDFLSRTHAASLAGLPGTGLILLGVAAAANSAEIVFLCLGGGLFLVLVGPLSAHLLARSAIKDSIGGKRP